MLSLVVHDVLAAVLHVEITTKQPMSWGGWILFHPENYLLIIKFMDFWP